MKILTQQDHATGVVLENGDEISADIVISNVDPKKTFFDLVEPTYLDPEFLLKIRNIRSRGTLAKVNLALDGIPQFETSRPEPAEKLCGGIICIAPSLDYLERAADASKYGKFSEQPFLEITIPSIADPSLAPAGKHVMSIWMQYAPYHLKGGSWNGEREALGDTVINVIDSYAPGFKQLVRARQILTPLDLEKTFGLTEGHIYHAELALDQMFFMRPVPGWARYRTPIEGLYLCGSGTHPGGGISGLPGYHAAKAILAKETGRD
jgi:phytoene dehydrogenase-like protein